MVFDCLILQILDYMYILSNPSPKVNAPLTLIFSCSSFAGGSNWQSGSGAGIGSWLEVPPWVLFPGVIPGFLKSQRRRLHRPVLCIKQSWRNKFGFVVKFVEFDDEYKSEFSLKSWTFFFLLEVSEELNLDCFICNSLPINFVIFYVVRKPNCVINFWI